LKKTRDSIPNEVANAKAPLQQQIDLLKQNLKKNEALVDQKVAQQTSQFKKDIQQLDNQLKEKDKIIARKQSGIQSLNEKIEEMTVSMSSAVQENMTLRDRLSSSEGKVNTIERSLTQEFNRQKEYLQKEINRLSKELQENKKLVAQQVSKIETLVKERDELSSEYFEMLDENISMSEQVEKMQKK
jgi:chromosome segregation ATPase